MAHVLKSRVGETSTTTGTGAFALSAALTAHVRFSAVCTTNDTTEYAIVAVDGSGNPTGAWECGVGTYSAANELTRTTVIESSNSGSAVDFAAGTKAVLMTPISSRVKGIMRDGWPLVFDKAGSNGIKIDTTTPVFGWKDILGPVRTQASGGTVPNFAAYLGTIYQWTFGTAGGAVEIFNEYHIPHDYVPSSDMYIHAHWSTTTTATGSVNWLWDIAYAKGYDQSVFEGTAGSGTVITVGATQAGTTAYKHEIAEVQFAAASGVISINAASTFSISSTSTTLTAGSASFSEADIGRTIRVAGAGSAGGNLDTTITAYTSTTQVTVGNAASTTVSAVTDAAKYRVLDRSLIEVDGLIMARCWRDSARAADTLNQAPWLHMTDVHYQSTGIATKARNAPFYA